MHDLASILRTEIVTGDLSPNERLVELDLAKRFDVSRGAVRLALLELANDGLVTREANRGARVRAVSIGEAIEISEVRMVMEGLCARKAAERVTADESHELRCVLDDMNLKVAAGDLMGYSGLNQTLHRRIRDISRHVTAAAIVERLRNQSVRQQFRLALVPGRPSVSLGEHRAIVEAVAARNPDRAELATRDHLASVIRTLEGMAESSAKQSESVSTGAEG